jgi:hypothetical protein
VNAGGVGHYAVHVEDGCADRREVLRLHAPLAGDPNSDVTG